MYKKLFFLVIMFASCMNLNAMNYRGIVYDVGLQYSPGVFSVDSLNVEVVKYDMNVIANQLHANAVRIEGQDIARLAIAAEIASQAGLKVFFNPWWMNAEADKVIPYMAEAARSAEMLRLKGVDITFVAGCEFSLFNPGILKGKDVSERIASLMEIGKLQNRPAKLKDATDQMANKLNKVLGQIVKGVRQNFKGDVTYSAGTWEPVAWSMFDVVGIDYYRDSQTAEEYLAGVEKYRLHGKPVWVMEVGCCAYEGAAKLGGGGFTICQGVDAQGNGIYAGGATPVRSEKEQADYAEEQIRLISKSDVEGMFVYVFSFPIAPYREKGHDADMTAYPIVKSFAKADPRSRQMPPWEPKEAFHRVGDMYKSLAE